MLYQQLPVPLALNDLVKTFWTLQSPEKNEAASSFRIVADGFPGMVFQQQSGGKFFQEEKELPPVIIYGQATTFARLHIHGPVDMAGVIFFPHAIRTIFGLSASELTNTCVNPEEIKPAKNGQLAETLVNAASPNSRITILSEYLLDLMNSGMGAEDKSIQYALQKMMHSGGAVALPGLMKELSISERSFERRFLHQTGITPKMFSRIRQFQECLNQLKNKNFDKLSDIAYDNGYADQSHFIRSFREFAGLSPLQYQKATDGKIGDISTLLN